MDKVPLYRNDLHTLWSLRVAGVLCVFIGIVLFFSPSDQFLAFCFAECGMLLSMVLTDDINDSPKSVPSNND